MWSTALKMLRLLLRSESCHWSWGMRQQDTCSVGTFPAKLALGHRSESTAWTKCLHLAKSAEHPLQGLGQLRERLVAGVKPHTWTKPRRWGLTWAEDPALTSSEVWMYSALFAPCWHCPLGCALYPHAVCSPSLVVFCLQIYPRFQQKNDFQSKWERCELIAFCLQSLHLSKAILSATSCCNLRVPPAVFSF